MGYGRPLPQVDARESAIGGSISLDFTLNRAQPNVDLTANSDVALIQNLDVQEDVSAVIRAFAMGLVAVVIGRRDGPVENQDVVCGGNEFIGPLILRRDPERRAQLPD